MAHPFRMGSPICTGCHWEFNICDWNDIDYIEVWSGTFPSVKKDNARAFALWTDRLNAGFRIAATSGRDWHAQGATEEPISVTYLGLEGKDPVEEQAVQAIAQGRVSLTIGPLVTMEVETADGVYRIGDCVPLSESEAVSAVGDTISQSKDGGSGQKNCQVRVLIDFSVRSGLWEIPDQDFALRIVGNNGLLAERSPRQEQPTCSIDVNPAAITWIRAELWGTVRGVRTLVAFTNPVYFSRSGENRIP
jgi:hypothetical protein